MKKHKGIRNEQALIKAINGRTYDELSNNMKCLVDSIYEDIDPHSRFYAEKCDPRGKPDIMITLDSEVHFISVKTGQAEQVHMEDIKKFVLFLRERGISADTQKTILYFQYGDGTLDGTGAVRWSYEELLPRMSKLIEKANEELNKDKELVFAAMDRFVFKGNYKELPEADYIYHGSVNMGVICSKTQIIKHLKRRDFMYMKNLHIGPIQFRPYARFTDFKETHTEKRLVVAFKWVGMQADLDYITERYDG